MKILIVQYLPSGINSNTKLVLESFLASVSKQKSGQIVETLDLLKTKPPIFDEASIQAYYKRNYGGQTLNATESQSLAINDQLISQLKSADILVIACPMHNFGFPAPVKAYIDAVVFHGETFAYDKKMMAGKKALTLFTSGGEYPADIFNFNYPNFNTISLMAGAVFGFMGFDEVKTLGTSLRDPQNKAQNLAKISGQIDELVQKWVK